MLNHGQAKFLGAPAQMVKKAENHVWQCVIDSQDFAEYNQNFKVIHHIKIEDKIRLRILSHQSPLPDAILVKPMLEDAYLWLLGDVKTLDRNS